MLFKKHVGHRQHQRMAGVHEDRAADSWFVEGMRGSSMHVRSRI
jgi:hypothetical protein